MCIRDRTGRDDSNQKRKQVLKQLKLPEHLTTNAMIDAINSFMSYEAVSYTHLTTKNQTKLFLHHAFVAKGELVVDETVTASVHSMLSRDIMCNHTAAHLLQAAPVSYTHLDVYKRQVL